MSLAEKLRAKTPMEIDKTEGKEGKRQAETEQAGSPHKRRPGGAGASSKAKGNGRGRPQERSGKSSEQSLLRAMSALTLRHEDSINALQADLSFVSYLETPGQSAVSVIPSLVAFVLE